MKKHPIVYEINTRIFLAEHNYKSLEDIPNAQLDAWRDAGIDWIWCMGVWEPSPRAREVACKIPGLMHDMETALPGGVPEHVGASPYAIVRYEVSQKLGGPAALSNLRARMQKRGLRLMLDFVPNHMALDNPIVTSHPQRFILGTREDLLRSPHNYITVDNGKVSIVAHGRDPYFDGWTDTVQLNYFNPDTRKMMQEQLMLVAGQCDGLRCDMAMLVTNEVMERTWGERLGGPRPAEFWPEAIGEVKARYPEFVFLAEVYWDMETRLQEMGFDYTYDKKLYDNIRSGHLEGARMHLQWGAPFDRLCRFVENHDEERAATAFAGRDLAAATLILTMPGMRLLHEGQLDGRRVKIPVQLTARPAEPVNEATHRFYRALLDALKAPVCRDGQWSHEEVHSAWPGNDTHEHMVAATWSLGAERRFMVVNLNPHSRSQCYVVPPVEGLEGDVLLFEDLLNPIVYERGYFELMERGMYFDMEPGGYHFFNVRPKP